ncbi:MAG: hypothetical protein ACREQD_15005, partial [Candidatus Binataceae bacterium]
AFTAECPTLDLQEQQALLSKAPSRGQSMKLFEACQRGSSGDISLGEIVIKKCEDTFLGKLSKSKHDAYGRKIKACWHKYARQSGTMYRSFEAFCAAGVAQTYAQRASAKN